MQNIAHRAKTESTIQTLTISCKKIWRKRTGLAFFLRVDAIAQMCHLCSLLCHCSMFSRSCPVLLLVGSPCQAFASCLFLALISFLAFLFSSASSQKNETFLPFLLSPDVRNSCPDISVYSPGKKEGEGEGKGNRKDILSFASFFPSLPPLLQSLPIQ